MINGGLEAPGPDYFQAFMRTPYATEHQFEFAKAVSLKIVKTPHS